MFHSTTLAVAVAALSLMSSLPLLARPVRRACTPRQTCRHCSAALFPEPFSPDMKFRCGLQQQHISLAVHALS